MSTLTARSVPGQRDHRYTIAIISAIILGVGIRAWFVLRADFPLHDGGLFIQMIEDLQHAHYRLPMYTTYNADQIPFAYPPLAFYLTGLINDLTHINLFSLLQYMPLVFNIFSIGAFYLLVKEIHKSQLAILTSMFAFVLLPEGLSWRIMGGGLTRSLGFLFAILALRQLYLFLTTRRISYVPALSVLLALTLLSHPEMAWFVAYSSVIFCAFRGRYLLGVIGGLCAAFGALILAAPWWITVIQNHGLAVFHQASDVGNPIYNSILSALFNPTNEIGIPFWALFAYIGFYFCCVHKRLFLPVWLIASLALHSRIPQAAAVVATALIAGIGVSEVVYYWITNDGRTQTTQKANEVAKKIPANSHAIGWGPTVAIGLVLSLTTVSCLVSNQNLLRPLTLVERQAMAWVAETTPQDSRFVIITPPPWWNTDRSSEWFPVLANRVSTITDQGYEWLAQYSLRNRAKFDAQSCATQDGDCLESWAITHRITFSYVYIAKVAPLQTGEPDGAWSLRNALGHDPRYILIYDGPGATIFERKKTIL